ncbi:MAG TPA: PQQ-binding-like beta-propeller repeat protein [Planctomycetota bacterium]|nr:PQQ-binding-like beta-propeller repeat protein [Planctomycetota bacterium]
MSRFSRFARLAPAVLGSVVALAATAVRGDDDALEGPWGTMHGDLSGTASTTGIAYSLGEGPIEEKWRLDVIAEGHDRPAGRSAIVFDSAGNLYWITSNTGGTGGVVRLVSVAPDGNIRWFGNDGAGNVHPLGSGFSGASPVVGEARVYGIGDNPDMLQVLQVAAYDKATGRNLWTSELPPSSQTEAGKTLSPVLYQGKLYAVGVSEGKSQDVHCVDAETGRVEWSSTIPEVAISNSVVGQMAFVPNAFGAGIHGIYFNGDSGSSTDGLAEVYGIQIHQDEATFGWMNEGGKVARSHVLYSEAEDLLYTLTWSDYGNQLYVFDPATGFVNAYQNSVNTGHGFYDVGAIDFDGSTIIAGGFDGYILRYTPEGDAVSDEVIFKGGSLLDSRYWGETRVLGQLLQDAAQNSILITATNSLEGCPTHVIALDVTQRKLLWEYDTGNIWDHQFLYAGGPTMGPDGKVYYFERLNPALVPEGSPNTSLIAIGQAAEEPEPTAGLIMVGYQGREIRGIEPACIHTGETIRLDGACSTGKGLSFQYSVDPPDDATVVHSSEADPYASIRFNFAGIYTIHLMVQNAAGTDEYTQDVCVVDVAPTCVLAVTDVNGAPIDAEDDDDEIPCLPAGQAALAEAGESFGGNLEFAFTVTPEDGVAIDQVDSSSSRARITMANPGVYTISLTLTNDLGSADCAAATVCVGLASGGLQRPGDMDQDGHLALTDSVRLLGHLFLGTFPDLPCEGGDASSPGPGDLALMDVNNNDRIDISDAVYILNWLFTGANGPPFLGVDCVIIAGCPDNSDACEG